VTATKDKQHPPRLEILPGGRGAADAGGADWRAFCERIGWQQLTEPPLPDDYEDRLAARLFGAGPGKLVSLEAARARLAAAPLALIQEPAPTVRAAVPRARRREGRAWPLAAVAVIALVGIGAALLAWRDGGAPPAANTVPTPAPERVLPAPAPEPLSPEPEEEAEPPRLAPAPTEPDPGLRRAERPPRPTPVRSRRPVEARVAQVEPAVRQGDEVGASRRLVDYRISPEREPARRALPAMAIPRPPWFAMEAAPRPPIRLASQPAIQRAPAYRHLAMSDGRSGSHAMAVVDLLALDRRLSEAL